jgi:hypothetical protein
MERELSGIVADTFPHISPLSGEGFPSGPGGARGAEHTRSGGCLLTLAELEQLRDSLAGRVQDLRRMAVARGEHERRAHELLERMKLEPGRYKFVRLPVKDLGEGGCGVWEVRPRLGLVGMLAGWWQVKLSSGCPLPRGHAPAWPAETDASYSSDPNITASVRRWRSVIDPIVFFSGIGICARNLRQRVWPQRRWLISRSTIAIERASHGHSRITAAASVSPTAIRRLSSARARRTSLARSKARMYCGGAGAGAIVAVAFMWALSPLPSRASRRATCLLDF